jgi:hypothetical protein
VAKEPVSSSRIALTPEDKLIADSFKANREVFLGLSRRVYIIRIRRSGASHLQTLVIHNSGVEITTNEGATARAVLVESSQVMVLSPVNKAVMIQTERFHHISKPKFGVCE